MDRKEERASTSRRQHKETQDYPTLNTWTFKLAGKREHLLRFFAKWTEVMDNLYLNNSDRHDSCKWVENPQDWMKPFDNEIFMLWCDYDSKDSKFEDKLNNYCQRHGKV